MSCHLVTCLPEEGLTLNNYQHPTCASPIETGAIKELSKQSNCSILQGTKVGSAKEYDQYVLIPQRVSQQPVHSSPSRVSNLKEIGYPPADPNIPQQYTYILNKHPRQSWSKDCSPAAYINIQRNHFPSISKLPQESPIQVPQERWNSSPQAVSLSPVNSGSLSFTGHERVVWLDLKSYFLNRI